MFTVLYSNLIRGLLDLKLVDPGSTLIQLVRTTLKYPEISA